MLSSEIILILKDFSYKELSMYDYKDIKIIAAPLINERKSAI